MNNTIQVNEKLATSKLTEKSFHVKSHFQPPPSRRVQQQYKFNTRTRERGTSIALFVAELRTLFVAIRAKPDI